MFKFKQGEHLEDLVTGHRGVVTSRKDHIAGCNQYWVQPRVGDDGKMIDGQWFDEPTLKRLDFMRLELDRPYDEPPG